MKDYRLIREAIVPRPREEVFAFFADPRNLEIITPPWLNFRITTPDPISMYIGARIKYRLSIRGIPLTWVSEITVWDPPHRFVDVQVKGPYRKWIHEHLFQAVEAGTEVVDQVEYQVPGGTLVNRFLVRPDVEKIFDFRGEQLLERFGRLLPTLEKSP
jgi:ligand-binding SRPBCC domain-containing protein